MFFQQIKTGFVEPWFLPDYLHSKKYDEDMVALFLTVIGIFSLVPLLSQFISLANCSLYTVWDQVWYGGLPKSSIIFQTLSLELYPTGLATQLTIYGIFTVLGGYVGGEL